MKYLVGLETTISLRIISTEDLGDDTTSSSLDFCMQWLLGRSLYHLDQSNSKLLKMPPFSELPAAPKAGTQSTWGHSCPLPITDMPHVSSQDMLEGRSICSPAHGVLCWHPPESHTARIHLVLGSLVLFK